MVELLDDVRIARASGMPIELALIDDTESGDRDSSMSARVVEAAGANPDGVVIALTGNVHARVTPDPNADQAAAPMGQHVVDALGADRVIALDVTYSNGTAWVCTDSCGETAVEGSGPADPGFALSLHLDDASSGFHGEYSVGPLTASPPAGA